MIEVTKEPTDLAFFGLENCCLCLAPTQYWYLPKDVACCPSCAEGSTPDDLPSKKEWLAKERARTAEAAKK